MPADPATSPTMLALTFDSARESWEGSTGLVKERVPAPVLDEQADGADRSKVILKLRYAGFCGSDRGIWWRKAFGDDIQQSLAAEGRTRRIVGHELVGEVVEVGSRVTEKYPAIRPGVVVSAESHIVCGVCHQCRLGELHVCDNDRILGITTDGCFAELAKVPAKILWPTDTDKVRLEVAAVQEPFGNAVHACQVNDLRGQNVVIVGCGTIGLFALLIARGMGARRIVGVEVDAHHAELARRLGADEVIAPQPSPPDRPWASDPTVVERVKELTGGVGADVVMEMAGFNSALNTALKSVRRGGAVVAFGVKTGHWTLEDGHRLVMDGIRIQGVVGRRIFQTWEVTRSLLESTSNGVQDAVWEVILNGGDGTIVPISTWEKAAFERVIQAHPKALIQF